MSQNLGHYIRQHLESKGMTNKAAAEAIGVTSAYFARVATGKVTRPSVDFCRKLAGLFDDSAIAVMRLAGWLSEDDQEALLEEMRELATHDPGFSELLKSYRELRTQRERELFLAMAKAAIEVARQE